MHLVMVLLIGLVDIESERTVEADLIEYNHRYDSDGKHLYDQVIGFRLEDGFYRVDWYIYSGLSTEVSKKGQYVYLTVQRDQHWPSGHWVYRCRAPHYRETWTQFDPERFDRDYFPLEWRAGAWEK